MTVVAVIDTAWTHEWFAVFTVYGIEPITVPEIVFGLGDGAQLVVARAIESDPFIGMLVEITTILELIDAVCLGAEGHNGKFGLYLPPRMDERMLTRSAASTAMAMQSCASTGQIEGIERELFAEFDWHIIHGIQYTPLIR